LRDATGAARRINSEGAVPVLCGGTGLYITSFMRETRYDFIPGDNELRRQLIQELGEKGPQNLLDEIAALDPEAAAQIHPNNHKRIVRTLELLRLTGSDLKKLSQQTRQTVNEFIVYPAIIICTDRKMLYNRIEKRIDAMMRCGLLEEARKVYDNRHRYGTVCQAIGYKEFFSYFENKASLEECIQAVKKASRHYAKRQITWFRNVLNAKEYPLDNQSVQQIAQAIQSDWMEFVSQSGRGILRQQP